MSSARVVMLGEATHGTEDFYRIRRLISQQLIEKHGFRFIAVEGDWPDCNRLNRYIANGEGHSALRVMEGFKRWPTWMLIEKHGFRFIAVEGDWPDCNRLNRYIANGEGHSALRVMEGFKRWPTWM